MFYEPGDPATEYRSGDFVERIRPGAFDKVIDSGADVAGLFNHDGGQILGRRSADTLALTVDNRGLKFAIPYDEADPDHVRVGRKIEKGELRGGSIGFANPKQQWEGRIRNLIEIPLIEVSIVLDPAYAGTSIGMRANESANLRDEYARFQRVRSTLLMLEIDGAT